MLRTRPASVAMIVVAALVTTSTAYLLATRTLVQAGPADDQPAAALPDATITEHEAAVQATLLCLAAAGLVPLAEPTRARSVTRITVDRQSVDLETAEAIIADCGAEAEIRGIESDSPGSMLSVTSAARHRTRASLNTCLPEAGTEEHGIDRKTICLGDIIAASGLQPLAGQQ